MDITESKLFKEYPRVAASADIFGFTYDDINNLLKKIENDFEASSYFITQSSREVALKSILVRVDLNRNDFFDHLEFIKERYFTDEMLVKDSGKYNLKAYKAILK